MTMQVTRLSNTKLSARADALHRSYLLVEELGNNTL